MKKLTPVGTHYYDIVHKTMELHRSRPIVLELVQGSSLGAIDDGETFAISINTINT